MVPDQRDRVFQHGAVGAGQALRPTHYQRMWDNAAGIALLDKVAADAGTVEKALVDQGFTNAVTPPPRARAR